MYEKTDGLFIASTKDIVQARTVKPEQGAAMGLTPAREDIPMLILLRKSLDARRRIVEYRIMSFDARHCRISFGE